MITDWETNITAVVLPIILESCKNHNLGNTLVGNLVVIFTGINSPNFFFRSVIFVWAMVQSNFGERFCVPVYANPRPGLLRTFWEPDRVLRSPLRGLFKLFTVPSVALQEKRFCAPCTRKNHTSS